MAAPVISSVTAPSNVAAGVPFDVSVVAVSGAPAEVFPLTATATNSVGEQTTSPFSVSVADAVTVTITSPDARVHIVQGPNGAGDFTVTID